jgi:cation diffusion facilitator CzcD-associated flavoprotein CzcO
VPAFTRKPKLAAPAKALALWNIRRAIKDPVLREKVTPDYEIGCKRILISNDYYPALAADNVDLVTDRISKVTGNAIVSAAGAEREVDVLVVATGVHVTDLPIAHHVTGARGRRLSDRFAETGQAAYKGTTVPEFPNLFFIVGPNTGLGHSSMVFIIESQVQYVRDAIRTMRVNDYAAVEPTERAFAEWNAELQRRMGPTVWSSGGCASWYLDDQGRNTTLWPRATFTFRGLLRSFDPEAYDVQAPVPTTPSETKEEVPA